LLWLTRRRLAKGQSGFNGRNATTGAFVSLIMFPTILTMFVSGLWHGAGYGFVVWGLLHGFYLTINHGWRMVAARLWRDRANYDRFMKPVGFVLTFVSVASAMIFFRSPTMASAIDLLRGIIGLNGMGVSAGPLSSQDFSRLAIGVAALMFVALACPNTLQILARFEPALGVKPQSARLVIGRIAEWHASLPWAIAVSAIAAIAIVSMGSVSSEFLYWQF
jgi:alginate O-acetyltransferase complex protein AlgI